MIEPKASRDLAQGVAGEAHGADERGLEAGVDLFAEAGDEDFHGAGVVFVLALPDALGKLAAGECASGFLHEDFEQLEFAGRKWNDFSGACDAAAAQIHLEVGDLKGIGDGGDRGATAEGFDAREQFLHGKGLGQVVVRAGFEALDAVLDVAHGGEDEDARGGVFGAEAFQHGEAVEPREIEIENDEVRRIGERSLEACCAIGL